MPPLITVATITAALVANHATAQISAGGHYEWRQTGTGPRSAIMTRIWVPDAAGTPKGHYEWRPGAQFGPRSTGPARVRVWVHDATPMERR
jgi:hypothetical protein